MLERTLPTSLDVPIVLDMGYFSNKTYFEMTFQMLQLQYLIWGSFQTKPILKWHFKCCNCSTLFREVFKKSPFWNDISNAAIACEVAVELSDLFAILTQSIRKFNSTNIVIPFLQEEFYLIPRFGSILDSVHIYKMLSYICYFEHLSVTCFNECRPSVSAYLLRQKMPAPWITNQPECY